MRKVVVGLFNHFQCICCRGVGYAKKKRMSDPKGEFWESFDEFSGVGACKRSG